MRRSSRQKTIKELMDLGVPKSLAFKAYYQYGHEAVSEIRKDPYRLVAHLEPNHWMDIDRVGHQLGFNESSQERIAGAFRCALRSSTNEGHVFLPQLELFKRVSRYLAYTDECAYYDTIDFLLDLQDIHILEGEETDSNSIYLAKMFHAESSVAFSLCQTYLSGSRLALQAPSSNDLAQVQASLGITLASAQLEAIASSLTNKIVIITGGPGTGKTTIIKGVLQLWSEKKGKVLLAAPTGRAAKRLSESTGKNAKTIHRLLEYRLDTGLFNRNAGNKIHADLMVVDESSMIDIQLMACLLEALPDYCHLLLVGDVDQLPAVGPGYVLHDLIESKLFKTIRLTDIYRQQKGSLISLNAKKINQGEMPEIEGAGIESGQDFYFIERKNPLAAQEAMLEMILERIPRQFDLDPKVDIQVLCPMIKRDLGVERMNELLQEKLNPNNQRFNAPFSSIAIGDKVMQTKNDYKKDVFNGDVGYVCDIEGKDLSLSIDFDGRSVVYTWNELETTSLAYAVTVHKSQGSEYPAVVIPISRQHYAMLQRNLLYTAVSRGKRLVVIVGSWDALQLAVRNNRISKRYTGLQDLLRETFATVR